MCYYMYVPTYLPTCMKYILTHSKTEVDELYDIQYFEHYNILCFGAVNA